jgi:hypothetical protein
LSVRFLFLCLLHLLPLPTFSFLPPSLFSHYPAIFVLSQGRTPLREPLITTYPVITETSTSWLK